jgi:hypothetical protein
MKPAARCEKITPFIAMEIMEKIHTASDEGGRLALETTCSGDDFPAPFTP